MRAARALAGGGLAALVLAPLAAAGGEPAVRVLLAETSGPFRVGDLRVEPRGDGLAAGGRPLGRVWRLEGPDGLRAGDLRVRGSLEVRRVPEGMWVVNRVPLEAYVAATLGREVYGRWDADLHKAQAVVARTYALHALQERSRQPWDLRGGVRGQVYGGIEAEEAWALAATRATRGQHLVWGDRPILAVYHAASGGRTASSEEVWGRPLPYLVSLPVENEADSPDTYWRVALSGSTLGRALGPLGIRVGRFRELRVLDRSPSGRAGRLLVRGSEGQGEISARALRAAVGVDVIRSTLFEVRPARDGVVLTGSGHGHGVGMSQWGAQAMAERGAGYRDILAAFYPGTRLAGAP